MTIVHLNHDGRSKLKYYLIPVLDISTSFQNNPNLSINQVCDRDYIQISFYTLVTLAGRDHMPTVRSIDEKFGRVVFNYNPDTCGYVSFPCKNYIGNVYANQ